MMPTESLSNREMLCCLWLPAARRALEWIRTSKARLVFRYEISDLSFSKSSTSSQANWQVHYPMERNIIKPNKYTCCHSYEGMCLAFLHLLKSSLSNLDSVQHPVQLNLIFTRATMVECSRLPRWSVWIFLSIKNLLSESALEQGIDNRPDTSLNLESFVGHLGL